MSCFIGGDERGRDNFVRTHTSARAFLFFATKYKTIYSLINGTEGVLVARVET
jgi:hypothetical protein